MSEAERDPALIGEKLSLLGRLALERHVRALEGGDRKAKVEALEVLGALREESAIPGIRRCFLSSDPAIRIKAASAAIAMHDIRLAPEVIAGLSDPVVAVRMECLAAATRLRLGEAAPDLRRLAADPAWYIRERSLVAACLIDQHLALELARLLLSDPHEAVRVAARNILR
ncbi:MAG: hypothetical protein RL095_2493 [Verrucomicrobiota bacterium]|jgi:HEAT repeat protein